MKHNQSQINTSKPLVSIIVPTKNAGKFLVRCLTSLKNQTYDNYEIVVVDNHSTDDTLEIAKRFTSHIYHYGNERSEQRNYGVEKANGELVYIVDADFVMEPEVVEQAVAEIAKGADAVIVHNTPDPTISWIARVRKFEVDMYKYDTTYSAARFLKKTVFQQLGGYNTKLIAGEDYDIQNRLNRGGYKIGYADAEAIHLGEPTHLWPHLKKLYFYGADFVNYQTANNEESKTQLAFIRPVYVKHWQRFVRQPFLAAGFVGYNLLKYGAGGVGYVSGKIQQRKQTQ